MLLDVQLYVLSKGTILEGTLCSVVNLWGVKGEKRRFANDWAPSQGSFNYNLRFL
ncbi:hypothetical protein M758_11G143400 [Ceratodon purpureus]|nr:hypothetical protein M758_11G143400 [Ceratodon purpureus]